MSRPPRMPDTPPIERLRRGHNDLLNMVNGVGSPLYFPDGTLAAPGGAFASETGSGIYRIGTGSWALVVNGVLAGQVFISGGHPQFLVDDGTVALPGFGFAADNDTGGRRTAANTGALVAGGSDALVWLKDANGVSVGVGVSPTVGFHVQRTHATAYAALIEQLASSAGSGGLKVKSAATTLADPVLLVDSAGTTLFSIQGDGTILGHGSVAMQKIPQVQACSANTALATTWAAVPSATISLAGIGNWTVHATFAWTEATVGDVGLTAQGRLAITGGTGSVVNSTSQTAATLAVANNTYFASQQWHVQVTAGTVTAKLETQKNGGVSGVGSTINAGDTTILGIFQGNPV